MAKVWLKPEVFPTLDEDEVHVWRLPLVSGDYRQLLPLLAADELRRAKRFVFEHHREHYVVGRVRMRQLLAAYVGGKPEDIEFAYENLGKPIFKAPLLHEKFRFNFSNSKDRGLLAIATNGAVGVDLECVRTLNDMLGLAGRYYAETETKKLLSLPEMDQPPAFFRCWTRKEAYLKAVGKGLTFPLRNVEVTLLHREPCQILHINSDVDEACAWALYHLEPFVGYLGALATRGSSTTHRLWDWSDEIFP